MKNRCSPGTSSIRWAVQNVVWGTWTDPMNTAFWSSGVIAYSMLFGSEMSNMWTPPFPNGFSSSGAHDAPPGTMPPPRSSVTNMYFLSGVGTDSCETATPSREGTTRLLLQLVGLGGSGPVPQSRPT